MLIETNAAFGEYINYRHRLFELFLPVLVLDAKLILYIQMKMNRLLCIIIFLVSPYVTCAQTFNTENSDSVWIEYHDGIQWGYQDIDNLIVGMSNQEFKDDYGKYYQVGFFIHNNRDSAVTFDPERVYADLLSNKGDTILLEVYTHEKLQKKIKRTQTWAMALYGLSAGLNAASAGYSTSYSTTYSNGYAYTSINRTYNANAAYQANMMSNMQMQALGKSMEDDRKIIEQGYLKLNTVNPGDAIVGYMNIKHKKGKQILVSLKIGECEYSYLWDVDKKKKSKKKD